MLDLTRAFQREPDPDRLRKLETYIEKALARTSGNRDLAFKNLIVLAESESVLGDLICDICAVAFAKWFATMHSHLQNN